MKFPSSLKLRITSVLLGILSAVTALLGRREDQGPYITRMYVPPQVYYAQEYLIASALLLVSAVVLFALSFRKKKAAPTEKK